MSSHEWVPPEQYFERVAKNIAAAGALLTDPSGRVLVVKPSYRDHWLFVGGQLDQGETPEQACRREAKEEIGFDLEPGGPLLVEWTPPQQGRPLPLIMFLFDGGIIKPDQVRLDHDELEDYRFEPPERAMPLMSGNGRRRLAAALKARENRTTLYRSFTK